MRFPDFHAAKREEVPQYGAYELLRQRNQIAAAEEKRLSQQQNMQNIETIYGGVSDSMGEDKSPISEALRMGKAGWNKMTGGGGPPPGAPTGAPPQVSGGGGLRSGAGPGGPQQQQVSQALRQMPPPPQAAPNMTASKGPTDAMVTDMIGKQMQGVGTTATPNMTAQVGGKPAANAMTGAASQMGGAAVPAAGAVTGAIPGLLKGDPQSAAKGAIGGGASSTLMAAAPAMAAAGPVGWAGLAGLAALSLYGMLG